MIGFDKIIAESIRKVLLESEQDDLYLKAYQENDADTAMRMVIQVAKASMPNTKVVDEDGEPMVVYHGTPNEWSVYDMERAEGNVLGTGIYTTKNINSTSSYGENIKELFVNIKNPFVVNEETISGRLRALGVDLEKYRKEQGYASVNWIDTTPVLKDLGYDGVIDNSREWYVSFTPSQIKSAELFTFDDSGNLIPLSRRFDFTKNDIRY